MIRRLWSIAATVALLCGSTGAVELSSTDARGRFPPTSPHVGRTRVPDLKHLRGAVPKDRLPVPGGLGAGTLYSAGALPVTWRAELTTTMIVHPEGIGVPNWLFTTATNRTELTIEVVGIYLGWGASLGVFDWSCQPSHPCPNGSVEPSWQWTREFSTLSCYVSPATDDGGHVHDTMRYVNRSLRRANGHDLPRTLPNWRNSVELFNSCTGGWDMVYRHDFRATQRDCSADWFGCGWWGPIIETFQEDPQEAIPELGFVGTTLRHDKETSQLGPAETYFTGPSTPWLLFHLQPNRSWGVGSFIAP